MAMARALIYPIFTLVMPAFWLLHGRRQPFPHLADALLMVPAIMDMGGNALGVYDRVPRADLVAHALATVTLAAAAAVMLDTVRLGRPVAAALAFGFASTMAVLWEFVEYGLMRMGAFGLNLTYANTLQDLAISMAGAIIGGVAFLVTVPSRRALPV
jgi:hypothetical protein